MHILDLPPEIVDNILYYSILSRDLPRALRLKLVCSKLESWFQANYCANFPMESFYSAFRSILFHTRILDSPRCADDFRKWHIRKHHGADVLWHDYLVFRCCNDRDESVGYFVEIRSVAKALLQHCKTQEGECGLDLDCVLDRLCWLVLDCGGKYPGAWQGWDGYYRRQNESPNLGLSLLSGATYFGYTSLVRDLLSQGYDPTQDDNLFPSAMYLASWTGQLDILQLLQEYLPEFEEFGPNVPWSGWRSKIGPGSLVGAAIRGDIDIVRLSLYPPSTNSNEEDNENEAVSVLVLGKEPGSVPLYSKLGAYITLGMVRTRSPEIYQYLQSFMDLADMNLQQTKNRNLAAVAGAGEIVMVRHLLATGADASDKDTPKGTALAHAARACHEDVVDLLLANGADPSERGRYRCGTPLTAAAKAGSMVMLRKLLDAGAQILATGADTWTLRYAVKLEHTAMVELLLDMGVGSAKGRGRVLKMAQDEGLESMVELLKSKG